MTETFPARATKQDSTRPSAGLTRRTRATRTVETADGLAQPRELLYARWLTDWVLKLCPDASEPLRLAARCQHLCRWMVPRDSLAR